MCLVYFSLRIKMSEKTCYHNHKDVILNIAKNYYESDKARLREQETDKCRNLSEEWKKEKERIWKKTDIIICLKKRNKSQRNIKNIIARLKSFNPINKIVFLILIWKYMLWFMLTKQRIHVCILPKVLEDNTFFCFNNRIQHYYW